MSSVMSSTATNSPNFFVTFSMRTYGLASGAVQGSNFLWVALGDVAMRSLSVGNSRMTAGASVPGHEAGPRAVQQVRELRRPGRYGLEARPDPGRGTDAWTVARIFVDERRRDHVGQAVGHRITAAPQSGRNRRVKHQIPTVRRQVRDDVADVHRVV